MATKATKKTPSKAKAKAPKKAKTEGTSEKVSAPRGVKKALVIVESPSKAKTIQKYLGREYAVKASVGHVKDLPKSKLGVDPDKNFAIDYQIIPNKMKVIEELKEIASRVSTIYLATDPDREGEAIAWHINDELATKGKTVHRVLFNAVTKPAILEAMQNPQSLNTDKFNAQQARRALDRLVGYKISPLLWDKVKRGLSAGRVQSVAVRLVVDREREVKAFKPEEYWNLEAIFSKTKNDPIEFTARYFKLNGEDPVIANETAMQNVLKEIVPASFKVDSIEQKERSRKPLAPFITSRLQQEAASKLGFSAKKTMTLAQHLYEGVDLGDNGTHGLITYMRTDSVRIDPSAIQAVREFILGKYGKEYLPAEPNIYKTKKSAQDAHEAIRPASLEYNPERVQGFLDKDEFRLYQLIWNRFLASQMTPAILDQTAIDLVAQSGKNQHTFRATGSVLKFAGFRAVYGSDEDDAADEQDKSLKLPNIKIGDAILAKDFNPSQHFTQPPPRFNDASLIRELEEKGIGRPSTYATILSNIQEREYVEKREGRYYPSEFGVVVTDLLVQAFPNILNSEFTAQMEDQLDLIEEGKANWKKILGDFWKPFAITLEEAKAHMKNVKRQEVATDVKCDRCSHHMNIKWGRMGSFLACSHYPECKNTQDFKKDEQGNIVIIPKEITDKKCDKCGNAMVVKDGKFGRFLACSDYPNCKTTMAISTGVKCPTCNQGDLVQKQSRYGKVFYSCERWPDCNYAIWDKPLVKPCPECKHPIMTEKFTKRQGLIHKCPQKECGFVEIIDPNGKPGGEPAAEEK